MAPLRIGIDYTAAIRQGAGIGRYVRQLVQAVTTLDAQDEFVLVAAAGGAPNARSALCAASKPNVKIRALPTSDRQMNVLWHRLRLPLPIECITGSLDIFHSPDFTLPPVRNARTLLTVHDLSFMRIPACSDPKLLKYLMRVVPASARRANVVLADSECTRADVIEMLGVDPSRVQVVYAGVDDSFQRVTEPRVLDEVRSRYRLPQHFILGVGTLQPRKNFERLVEAFAMLAGAEGGGPRLVLAGAAGWKYQGIFERVERLGLRNAVLFPGYVADRDLPALYSMADLFVFPSLYEGFGIPPLEAMACGTPVVTSNVSSLPEVVGDAALTIDPTDTVALARAMQRMLNDPHLRSELVQRGAARASNFTWRASAEKLLAAYRGLC